MRSICEKFCAGFGVGQVLFGLSLGQRSRASVSSGSTPPPPLVVVSGVMDDASARRAKWLRAFECLPKPFDCRELVALVRAAIASRKACRTVLRSRRQGRFV